MKRKLNKIKSLLLTIAASSVVNWIVFIMLIVSIICGFDTMFYIIGCFTLWFELMLMDVNTHYYVQVEEELKEPVDKQKAMIELQNLYQQLDSMKDVETKKVVEEFIKQKERELAGVLNG